MANKKSDISQLDKLEQIFNNSVEELAYNILEETELLYESCIQSFYDDYTPVWYDRTGYSMYGSSGYDTLYNDHNIHPFEGGWETNIDVTAANIPGNPYRANKAWVFGRTFIKGIHGINVKRDVYGKPNSKTFKRVYGKLHQQKWLTKLQPVRTRKGWVVRKNVVETQKIYRNVSSVAVSTMQNMVPTPLAMMKKGFKKINGHRKLKQEFNEILKKNISSAK